MTRQDSFGNRGKVLDTPSRADLLCGGRNKHRLTGTGPYDLRGRREQRTGREETRRKARSPRSESRRQTSERTRPFRGEPAGSPKREHRRQGTRVGVIDQADSHGSGTRSLSAIREAERRGRVGSTGTARSVRGERRGSAEVRGRSNVPARCEARDDPGNLRDPRLSSSELG